VLHFFFLQLSLPVRHGLYVTLQVWDGGGMATAAGNCQLLCAFCHADKTAKEVWCKRCVFI